MLKSLNVVFSTETPSKPTLTVVTKDPVDGDTLALNCNLTNDQVDAYQFFQDGQAIGLPQPNNILNIAVSTQSQHSGDYQCSALVDSVNSTLSDVVKVSGKLYCQ